MQLTSLWTPVGLHVCLLPSCLNSSFMARLLHAEAQSEIQKQAPANQAHTKHEV